MKKWTKGTLAALGAAAAICAGGVTGIAGNASAASKTGWVTPVGATGFLATSTITNAPYLTADAKIYQSFGLSVPSNKIGAQARLFKSGALCQATPWSYNSYSTREWTKNTDNTCGSGWYNSHGFVAVRDDATANYDTYLTFPSDPLQWTDPSESARRVSPRNVEITNDNRTEGTNAKGQKYGSAATTDADEMPDLVLTIGDNGKVGYVESGALEKISKNGSTLPVWDKDKKSQLDTFTVG